MIIGIIGGGTAGTIAGLHIVKALGKPSARTRVLAEGLPRAFTMKALGKPSARTRVFFM